MIGRSTRGILAVLMLMSSILVAQETRAMRRAMTAQEFERLREKVGVYEQGRNYNVVVDGFGTGLRPPTAEVPLLLWPIRASS